MGSQKSNTDGLKKHAKAKSQLTAEKVDKAIRKMMLNKQLINFNSVSKESGVTKSYLYNNSGFRERIELLRSEQEGLKSAKQVRRNTTNASKDVIITAIKKHIKELEEENKLLKKEIERLRGTLYDDF
jgi:uncharacterized small protein (DUF1192 family)